MEEKIVAFLTAIKEAEDKRKNKFQCPLCGGTAWWVRAVNNNHLHAGCNRCKFRVVE